MKKRVVLVILSFALLIILVFGKMMLGEKKEYKGNTELTEAQVAKSIALLFFTQEECDEEQNDYFSGIAGTEWYEKYINILIDKRPDIDCFEASHSKMKSSFTYKETKNLMQKLGVSQEQINQIISGHDEKEILDYTKWFNVYECIVTNAQSEVKPEKCQLTIVATAQDWQEQSYNIITDRGKIENSGVNMERYKDTRIDAFVKGTEIVAIGGIADGVVEYKNVWIAKMKKQQVNAYIAMVNREFEVDGIDKRFDNVVADIKVCNHKVTDITIKKDVITGKVLKLDDNYIEVEGFGKVPLDETYTVYRNTEGIEGAVKEDILVGYDAQTIYVAEGKICAVVIDKKIKTNDIRVVISTDNFKSRIHENVRISCAEDFVAAYDDKEIKIPANTEISIDPNSEYLKKGRVTFKTCSGKGKICINSINRGYGNPLYRGSIEVALGDGGLIIVNELSLEEYLYAVIPSEMPVSYGKEALKAQAICARSYAYKHLLANALSEYGGHVDDSTRFQVYNNSQECEQSISAVDETKGKIMMYDGEVISAYFYSNSCGSTTVSSIWGSEPLPYIQGKLVSGKGEKKNLKDEKEFSEFIRKNQGGYDSAFAWYRWNVVMTIAGLQKAINNNIEQLYDESPEAILTKNEDGNYVSQNIESIGKLKSITVGERLDGGVLNSIIIKGSDATVKVLRELNIRKILSPYGNNINRQDGTVVDNMSLMPSAYFVLDEIVEEGEITGYNIVGGGCGHGAGMSQDAAMKMGETMDYEQILKFFYDGITIETIWDTE